MLTAHTTHYLKGLAYNPSAERIPCIIPLGGIYWSDEIPDFDTFFEFPEDDQASILRLFSIRFTIWAGHELAKDDASYWEEARTLFPHCPIFRRLQLSPDDQKAQEATMKNAEEFFDAMFSGATDATISESKGLTKFSITHKLTDETDKAS